MDHRSGLVVAALLLAALAARAQSTPKATMNQYVLIFRQTVRQLTPAELEQRALEIRAWAKVQNERGHKLEPRSLAPEAGYIGADGKRRTEPVSADRPLTALLFVEAKDLEEAMTLAEGHPGLKYGVQVEVRPWSTPTPAR